MSKSELGELHAIMVARYQAQQANFQKIVARETALRTELKRLEAQSKDAATRPLTEMKAIGADVIWHAWLTRTKTALNTQLAQVLAQKDSYTRTVRRAYGKMLVTGQMLDDATQRDATERSRAQLESAMEQAIVSKLRDQ